MINRIPPTNILQINDQMTETFKISAQKNKEKNSPDQKNMSFEVL